MIDQKMQNLLDNLTKPKGSLGDLEDFAVKLAGIQQRVPPKVENRLSIVFAGDHGITAEGVSLYPSEVTAQMVQNFAGGGAAINVLSRHCGSEVRVVDAGISGDTGDAEIIDLRIGPGTRNFASEEAMSQSELDLCLNRGKSLAAEVADQGFDLVSLGDMGIGNTTTAAALLAANGLPLEEVVDRGTGIDDDTLKHKLEVVSGALELHGPFADVYASMRCVGGFEICMIAGFILGLRGKGVACVIDGFPVSTGAYLAWRVDPAVANFMFAGHQSKVKGHRVVLDAMGLEPILDLNMRLGEGTGAVLGGFLLSVSAYLSSEMASFDSAGVSRSEGDEEDY